MLATPTLVLAASTSGFTPQVFVGLLVFAPLIALSLTLHEFAHAYAAERMGDHTARLLGRVTLNPLAHLDPLGTLMLIFGPIGWARPVPIDPSRFRNPRRGMIVSVLAGPASNLLLAFIGAMLIRAIAGSGASLVNLDAELDTGTPNFITWTCGAMFMFVLMNVYLCLFNLVPLYPLDGHHILREMLHGEARQAFQRSQHMGIVVLLAIIVMPKFGGPDLLSLYLDPVAMRIIGVLLGTTGLAFGVTARQMLAGYFTW